MKGGPAQRICVAAGASTAASVMAPGTPGVMGSPSAAASQWAVDLGDGDGKLDLVDICHGKTPGRERRTLVTDIADLSKGPPSSELKLAQGLLEGVDAAVKLHIPKLKTHPFPYIVKLVKALEVAGANVPMLHEVHIVGVHVVTLAGRPPCNNCILYVAAMKPLPAVAVEWT